MFDGSIFWASIGGWGGILFIAVAFFLGLYLVIYEEKPVLAIALGAPMALAGIAGIALSLALTNAWEYAG